MVRLSSSRRTSRGQALVETALILPLFLILVVAVVDMGRAVWATTSLASAAREAARFAIVRGGSSAVCQVGTSAGTVVPPAPSPTCPYPSPSKQGIVDAAVAAAVAGGSNVTVTVCYGVGCTGNTDTGNNARGQPITVVVTSTVDLVVPALLGRSSFTLSGSSTMVVNH